MPRLVHVWISSDGVPTHLCNTRSHFLAPVCISNPRAPGSAVLAEVAANDLQQRGMRTLEVPLGGLRLNCTDCQSQL